MFCLSLLIGITAQSPLFYIKLRLKILKKGLLKKGLYFGEHFYGTSKQVSTPGKLESTGAENSLTEAFSKIFVYWFWFEQ